MHNPTKRWIQAAWRREILKEENTTVNKSITTMKQLEVKLRFRDNAIRLQDELIERQWKLTWKKVKTVLKKVSNSKELNCISRKNNRTNCLENGNKIPFS